MVAKQVVGIDIAKRVFQLHWIDMESGEIVNLQLKREKFLEHFANRQKCLIGMEACRAQHWASDSRQSTSRSPGQAVERLRHRQQNDRHDARAIWTAVQQPHLKAGDQDRGAASGPGTAPHAQPTGQVPHRPDQRLAELLTEYGEVVPQGKAGVRKGITEALAGLEDRLPAMVIDTLREQWDRIGKMDEEIATIEQRIKLWLKNDDACKRIAEIPGVGPLTATAAVAIMGDAKAFKSGREFAAFAGTNQEQGRADGSSSSASASEVTPICARC
jgi:transposase